MPNFSSPQQPFVSLYCARSDISCMKGTYQDKLHHSTLSSPDWSVLSLGEIYRSHRWEKMNLTVCTFQPEVICQPIKPSLEIQIQGRLVSVLVTSFGRLQPTCCKMLCKTLRTIYKRSICENRNIDNVEIRNMGIDALFGFFLNLWSSSTCNELTCSLSLSKSAKHISSTMHKIM